MLKGIIPYGITTVWGNMKYHVFMPCRHSAGDTVCLLSAARTLAKFTGNEVTVEEGQDIVEAYGDKDFWFGMDGKSCPVFPERYHRQKSPGPYFNYYGIYLYSMGLVALSHPKLDLPIFPRGPAYAVIQTFSHYATNPPMEYLQGIVAMFKDMTGLPVFVIGNTSTSRDLKGVQYDLLRDSLPYLMQVIQNAAFVLTPRSLSAHVASGYSRPSFVWCPNDGENWHLDYPDWPCERVLVEEGYAGVEEKMSRLVRRCRL